MTIVALSLLLAVPSGSMKVAVFPTKFEDSAKSLPKSLFDETVLAAVQAVTQGEVVGQDDIDTLLGFEKQRDVAGCDEASCFAQIGGALGVDKLVAMRVGKVGEEWAITAKLIDIKKTTVDARTTKFIAGEPMNVFKAIPDIIRQLFSGGGFDSGPPAGAPGGPAALPRPGPVATVAPPPSWGPPAAGAAPDALVAQLMSQTDELLANQQGQLSTRLWPGPLPADAVARTQAVQARKSRETAEQAVTLEYIVRERERRLLGALPQGVGEERYDQANKACNAGGDGAPCRYTAALMLNGFHKGDTPLQAAKIYKKACERKDAAGCEMAKALVASFSVRDKLKDDAGRLLAEMCLAGEAAACETLPGYDGKGWVNPMVAACGAKNAMACYYTVKENRQDEYGGTARTVGFWFMVLGAPGMALMGAGIGAYAGLLGSIGGSTSGVRFNTGLFVGLTVGIGVGFGAVTFITGLIIWMVGKGDVREAESIAADYENKLKAGGGALVAPQGPAFSVQLLDLGPPGHKTPGLGLAWAF